MVGIIKNGRLMLNDSIENVKKSHSKRTLLQSAFIKPEIINPTRGRYRLS